MSCFSRLVKEALAKFTKGKQLLNSTKHLGNKYFPKTFAQNIWSGHYYSFYKKTGEIVAIKMIDLEAELVNDDQNTALGAIA